LVNSKNEKDEVVKRIVRAQEESVTRLELSLNFNEKLGNSAYRTFSDPDFLTEIDELFNTLLVDFLNAPHIKSRVHKCVNVSKLLKKLSK